MSEMFLMASGSKIRKFVLSAFLLGAAVLSFHLGYRLTFHDPGRVPAGLVRAFDFSNLTATDADRAARNRLLEGLKLVQVGPNQGFELGAFYSRDMQGQTQFVCDQYPKISMKYNAEGMAVSGERPALVISGPCLSSEYEQSIVALLVPLQKLIKLQPRDGQFKMDNLEIEVRHVGDDWPISWVLTEIRLIQPTKQQITLSQDEIKNIKGKNLSIEVSL